MSVPAPVIPKLSLRIDIPAQRLMVLGGNRVLRDYAVSTAQNGPGEVQDSYCTPRGQHEIASKIGAGCARNTVFVSREPTGEVWCPELRAAHPGRDWILTRILWLRGLEPGVNVGAGVDTWERYIYIHGAPDDVPMGKPGSAGCIRMRNADIEELFEQVEVGTRVTITG
jgi:hypothetical protein